MRWAGENKLKGTKWLIWGPKGNLADGRGARNESEESNKDIEAFGRHKLVDDDKQ
jgi:hypothetical protein